MKMTGILQKQLVYALCCWLNVVKMMLFRTSCRLLKQTFKMKCGRNEMLQLWPSVSLSYFLSPCTRYRLRCVSKMNNLNSGIFLHKAGSRVLVRSVVSVQSFQSSR